MDVSDPLDEAMTAPSLGGVTGAFVEAQAPWGLWLDDSGDQAFAAVVEGTCWLHRGTAAPIPLATGDFVVLRAGGSGCGLSSAPDHHLLAIGHLLGSSASPPALDLVEIPGDGPTTSVVCGVYRAGFEPHPLLRSLPALVHVGADSQQGRWMLDETLRLLAVELRRDRPGAQFVRERLLDVLFVHGMRAWLASVAGGDLEAPPGLVPDPAVAAAIARMHADTARGWTLQALAAEVGLSRAAFTRRFTTCVGEPPLAYLTRWRLALAARRLRDSDDSLAVIARDIGYSSEFTFSRAFTRSYHKPPGRYRTEQQRPLRWPEEKVAFTGR
jgi:AraC-like DNA-binding protein